MTQLRSNFLHAALSWSISSCPSRRSWRSSFSFFSFSLASFSLTFSSLSLWRAFSRRVILALRSWRSSEAMGGASEVMGGASEVTGGASEVEGGWGALGVGDLLLLLLLLLLFFFFLFLSS